MQSTIATWRRSRPSSVARTAASARDEETFARTVSRDNRDRQRYLRLYGIDIDRFELADLVVDTTLGDQEYVAGVIVSALLAKSGRGRFRKR